MCLLTLLAAGLKQIVFREVKNPPGTYGFILTDCTFSLVGTTAVGFNLFLGGSMAKGRNLSSAQRGIAFSCCSAFLVSELILMVGAGHYMQNRNTDQSLPKFTIAQLTDFVEEFTGPVGVLVFAIGFIAAALSSQLATPLGATATAESIFFMTDRDDKEEEDEEREKLQEVEKQEPELESKEENTKQNTRNMKIMKHTTNIVMVGIATVVISTNGKLEGRRI